MKLLTAATTLALSISSAGAFVSLRRTAAVADEVRTPRTTFSTMGVATEPSMEATATATATATTESSKQEPPSLFVSPVDFNPMELPPDEERPGRIENEKFDCAPSVDFWKTFASEGNTKNLQRIQQIIQKYASMDSVKARAYWASHVLRTGYFISNAVVGLIGHDLHERFIARRNASNGNNESDAPQSRLQLFTSSDVGTRLLLEAILCYEQDFAQVEENLFKLPWDAAIIAEQDQQVKIQTNHRQFNPFFVLQETGRLVSESIGVYGRQNKFQGKPSDQLWLKNEATANLYPEYYLNDFHYQTDGWLSSESASRYEVSTETLFLGRQDSMQRQTLIPLLKHFKSNPPSNVLEVACGTGRFATFMRDNLPLSTNVTLTDLSPFYLEKARQNDEYWRGYQTDKKAAPATLVQANAERLPFEDNSFDAVTCVYLFHELPEEARRNVANELARVVKPGGMVVLTDSIQLGDRPPIDTSIGRFSNLNEPHYQNYVRTEISPLFLGLIPQEKHIASSTKTLSFLKPE